MHALGSEAVLPRDRHRLDDRPEPALEDRVVERLLAGEVVVEARGGDPHLARQVSHRHALHAARREQALGGVEDDLARGRGRTLANPALRGRRRHGGRCNERTFVTSRGDRPQADRARVAAYPFRRVQAGGRFSTKAAKPSRASSEASDAANIVKSIAVSCRFRSRLSAARACGPVCRTRSIVSPSAASRPAPPSCRPPISPPTQKWSPAAVTRSTSSAGSRSASTAAFLRPWYISMVSALRRSGRSMTTRSTPSALLACRWREPRSTAAGRIPGLSTIATASAATANAPQRRQPDVAVPLRSPDHPPEPQMRCGQDGERPPKRRRGTARSREESVAW